MNRTFLLLRSAMEEPQASQRRLAALCGISLGQTNALIHDAMNKGLLIKRSDSWQLCPAGMELLAPARVDGALIIAAGFGSRFAPLTFEQPKGLLKVFGERMIERQICQLHERGIRDITIAVGYLKEKFEYLTDKYGVKLLYNPEYSSKNNLSTIYRAREVLRGKNMYLLSSDNWMKDNIYHAYEPAAWYSAVYMSGETAEWAMQCGRDGRISRVDVGGRDAWCMYGPVYFSREFSDVFLPLAEKAYHTPGTENFYWENVLISNLDSLCMYMNKRPAGEVYEFENLEELRLFDASYRDHSDNAAMELVSRVFDVPEGDICGIKCLKAGMTNKSFLFDVKGRSYICRVPGKGTELLIKRAEEAAVLETIKDLGICEEVVYIDPDTGYKIARFYTGARNADPSCDEDMKRLMAAVRSLHQSGKSVKHSFDIAERIRFYENLCLQNGGTRFEDYASVKEKMQDLLSRLENIDRPCVLAHVDCVADNFLFLPDGTTRLIDWEYAGMADPILDVAMCAIYSFFDKEGADRLLFWYLGRAAAAEDRFVLYAYMALGGFLWALWAVYKSELGVEFGDYTIKMYRYAKDFYRLAAESL